MRSIVLLWLIAGCGRLAFDYADPDSGLDGSPPSDGSLPPPAFVQNFERKCAAVKQCTVATPGLRNGNLVLVTVTYNPSSAEAMAVEDHLGRAFNRIIGPVAWSPVVGSYHSELWWARSQGTNSVTVTLNGTSTSLLNIYVDEFVATAIDQTAAASGVVGAATTVSSGSRNVTAVPGLIFGHGEGQGPTVYPVVGFTLHSNANANVEASKQVTTPGSYDAAFMLDGPGDWVAIMVTLR